VKQLKFVKHRYNTSSAIPVTSDPTLEVWPLYVSLLPNQHFTLKMSSCSN